MFICSAWSSIFFVLFVLGLTSCSSPPKRTAPVSAELTLSHGDGRVGSYVSSWRGFHTSSYWIEGPEGLILIDSQFLTSAAEEMIDWAEKVTGKKAVLAIVLHPNPDKFNGTAVFQKRGIRVVTSEQVLDLIPEVHRLRLSWFYDRFKPDYPLEQPKPESFGGKSGEIAAAGITVKLHVLGKGCSGAHVVAEYDGHVFVGDLVTQGFHSWLELGELREWLKRLDEIRALDLRTVISIVEKHHPRKGVALSDDGSDQILAEIVARYPAYEYPKFAENGLPEVWNHLAK